MSDNLKNIINCKIDKTTKIWNFVNLYGCTIGKNCMIGAFVEIQEGATIGNNVRIQSHTFLCKGVTIQDNVFVGHGVMFINDNYPKVGKAWRVLPTVIKTGASIGSNTTILGGITIGKNALVGAGSVVTKNVPPDTIVSGNPARIHKSISVKKLGMLQKN